MTCCWAGASAGSGLAHGFAACSGEDIVSERVLLAGCGDLGLRVARLLRGRGDEVWALRRSPPIDADSGIHWVRADLTVAQSLQDLPAGLTQLVYLPAPDRRDACTYGALFADGLRNLLAAEGMAAVQRVLLVSSSAVYGEHGDAWVDEDTPTAPLAFNGTLLRDVEQWLAAQPVRSVVLRLAGLYGPGRLQLLERLRAGLATVPRVTRHWAAGCPVRLSGNADWCTAAARRSNPGYRWQQAVEQCTTACERVCAAMAGRACRVCGAARRLNRGGWPAACAPGFTTSAR